MSDKKFLSRRAHRRAILCLAASICAFFCMYVAITSGSVLALFLFLFLTIALLVPAVAMAIRGGRCPYCGTPFRGLHWSKPDAGYCNKCGKMMVFDDFAQGNRKE